MLLSSRLSCPRWPVQIQPSRQHVSALFPLISTLLTRCQSRYPSRSSYSTHSPGRPPSPQHSIYVSKSTNPYFNLSFEDWLFRHKAPNEPLLLLYRDDPCVVIGRNQNPWKEVNLGALRQREDHIPFIRRRSGGGTVYHDLGNTNFSIHLPRASFDRHTTARVILRAVRSLGVDAIVNDRNDICVGKEKICILKALSLIRSAYKIVNKRAYHHGTMLISTRLDTLGCLLHSDTKDTMETKGVASVRSPVRNLQHFNTGVTHEGFVDAVIREFREEYPVALNSEVQTIGEDECKDLEYIRTGMSELPSWEWAYGQTPEFTYAFNQSFEWGTVSAKIRSKHGIILDCRFNCSIAASTSSLSTFTDTDISQTQIIERHLEKVEKLLQGRRYGFVLAEDLHGTLALRSDSGILNDPAKDIARWLETNMNS